VEFINIASLDYYWTSVEHFEMFSVHVCLLVSVHEVTQFLRRYSRQSRATDTGAGDTETEPLDSPTKPVRSVSV